jgi:hypothetical protein
LKILILVGYGWFILTCLVVGVRVLRLALRTHQLPEWAMGIVLFCSGGIGYPLLFIQSLAVIPDELRGLSFGAGLMAINIGSGALYLFNWRVFRQDSPAAVLLFAGGLFVLAWSFAAEALITGFADGRILLWYVLGSAARAIPYGWTAVESLRHYARLRRSLRFGLADPLVVDRFRLWGLGALAVFASFVIVFTSGVIGDPTRHPPAVVAVAACLGMPAAMGLGLAFHPPAFYRRRFEGRGQPAAPPAG